MQERLRILFYTCGGHRIGMGNVARALAIAQAFEASGKAIEIRFAVQEHGEAFRHIESCGYQAILWGSSRLFQPDVVIVDMPQTDPALFEEWSANGALTVCSDDPGPGRYAADLAFTMLYAPTVARPTDSATEEFGEFGHFDYSPLRPEFANLPKKLIRDQAHRLLVVHGGSDASGSTVRVCEALTRLNRDVEIDVVMGQAFRHETRLRQLLHPDGRFRLHREPSMVTLMREADVAISAAGVTALELAAVGVPMVLLVSRPHEVQTAVALERRGAAVYLGQFPEVTDARLRAVLRWLLSDPARRSALSRRAHALVDGAGAQRIVETICARLNGASVKQAGELRP